MCIANGEKAVVDESKERNVVRINLTLAPDAGDLLDRITHWRFPGRQRVQSLTIEQLIREEAKRIEEEAKRQGGDKAK